MLERLKRWAGELKAQVVTLWFCRRHPDMPWSAKLLAALVVAYAFSPIDLIPDFVPVLGYLDDLLIVPLGIILALRMVPPDVLEECRVRARAELASGRPVSRAGAVAIITIWLLGAVLVGWLAYRVFWT